MLIEIDSWGNMADERCWTYKSLGMDRRIPWRDFLNGIAVAIGSVGRRPGKDGGRTSQGIIRRC